MRATVVSTAILLALAAAIPASVIAQTAGSLELLGSHVTPASTAVAAWGDMTVVGTTRGILVQDLRDPGAMTTLHDLLLGAAVQAVQVAGDSALVTLAPAEGGAAVPGSDSGAWAPAAGERRLIDLAAAGGPAIVPMPDGYAFPNLRVGGESYIVETGANELTVDRWTGSTRERVGSLAIPGVAINALAVDGATAYVGQGGGAYDLGYLSLISLADPSHPVLAGRMTWGRTGPPYTGLYRFTVRDGLLYVVETSGQVVRLRIVDVHAPAAPVDLSILSLGNVTTLGLHLNLSGGRLLAESYYYDPAIGPHLYIRVVNVADPLHPGVAGDYQSTQLVITSAELHDRSIWCVTPQALRLLQLPENPGQILDRGPTWFFLPQSGFAATSGAAYVTRAPGPRDLAIVDTRDPAHPTVASVLTLGLAAVPGVVSGAQVIGSALLLPQESGVIGRYDITSPLAPSEVDNWRPARGRVRNQDGTRLIVSLDDGEVDVYEMADPFSPRLDFSLPPGGYCDWIAMRDDLNFVHREDYDPADPYYSNGDSIIAVRVDPSGGLQGIGRLHDRHGMWYGTYALRGDHLLVLAEQPGWDWGLWDRQDAVFDVHDPTNMHRVYEGELPQAWSGSDARGWRALSVLGYHLQVSGSRAAVYDMSQQYLDPPLIAELTGLPADPSVAVVGDLIYLLSPGRLDIVRFRPDAVPPTFSLGVAPDSFDPSRAMVSLLANEALNGQQVTLAANGAALVTEMASAKFFRAEIPSGLNGRVTIVARAVDLCGNASLDSTTCTLGSAGADGGSLRDEGLGLTLQVPAGAFSEPVRLVLSRQGSAAAGGGSAPTTFWLKPVSVSPQRALTIWLPAPGSITPRLEQWRGTGFSACAVQIDRASGLARATVDRLGQFRLNPDGGAPAIARTALALAAPSPFNVRTNLAFELAAPGPVRLQIYDARGRLVRTLHDGPLPAGLHGFDWDGRDGSGRPVGSGVYVYRLTADGRDLTRRCMLVK